eukprot:13895660-Alexandrium_andersonii.AAC.1
MCVVLLQVASCAAQCRGCMLLRAEQAASCCAHLVVHGCPYAVVHAACRTCAHGCTRTAVHAACRA